MERRRFKLAGVSVWDKDAVRSLRGAVYRGDGSAAELLQGRPIDDVLQLAGDEVVRLAVARAQGSAELAASWIEALRKRSWYGDEELIDQLAAAIGHGATPLLRALPIDLDELSTLLEGDPLESGCRVNVKTGECWPASLEYDEDDDEHESDPDDRWLYLDPKGSRDVYRDMEIFIAGVTDADVADRLEIAIAGKGAFRRFKDVLASWPEEFDRYFLLSEERRRGRARALLAAHGYRPTPQRFE